MQHFCSSLNFIISFCLLITLPGNLCATNVGKLQNYNPIENDGTTPGLGKIKVNGKFYYFQTPLDNYGQAIADQPQVQFNILDNQMVTNVKTLDSNINFVPCIAKSAKVYESMGKKYLKVTNNTGEEMELTEISPGEVIFLQVTHPSEKLLVRSSKETIECN